MDYQTNTTLIPKPASTKRYFRHKALFLNLKPHSVNNSFLSETLYLHAAANISILVCFPAIREDLWIKYQFISSLFKKCFVILIYNTFSLHPLPPRINCLAGILTSCCLFFQLIVLKFISLKKFEIHGRSWNPKKAVKITPKQLIQSGAGKGVMGEKKIKI